MCDKVCKSIRKLGNGRDQTDSESNSDATTESEDNGPDAVTHPLKKH